MEIADFFVVDKMHEGLRAEISKRVEKNVAMADAAWGRYQPILSNRSTIRPSIPEKTAFAQSFRTAPRQLNEAHASALLTGTNLHVKKFHCTSFSVGKNHQKAANNLEK